MTFWKVLQFEIKVVFKHFTECNGMRGPTKESQAPLFGIDFMNARVKCFLCGFVDSPNTPSHIRLDKVPMMLGNMQPKVGVLLDICHLLLVFSLLVTLI